VETELGRAKAKRINLCGMLEAVTALYTSLEADLAGPEGAGHGGARPQLLFHPTANTDVTIEGVEGRLVQVFQNLVDNALSFSPPGGKVRIDLAVERGNASASIAASTAAFSASHWARITISDEGPGIPEGKLESIFDRFYSERPSHEAFGRHSGLGLSIARQIVEAHRGRLYAGNLRDASGNIQGACFTVDLPLAKEEEDEE
jgi:two-component system sensor histidine kinase ChvG